MESGLGWVESMVDAIREGVWMNGNGYADRNSLDDELHKLVDNQEESEGRTT